MKVKDFLGWFDNFDQESELKIELFEEIYNDNLGCHEEIYTTLDVSDTNYLDEADTVFMTMELGD